MCRGRALPAGMPCARWMARPATWRATISPSRRAGASARWPYANGGYVNLRRGPSLDYAVVTRVTSGTTISILDASYEWNYVSATVNGATYTGDMHDSLIIKSTTTATVSTRNGGKVNVRRGPSSAYGSIGSLKSGTRRDRAAQGQRLVSDHRRRADGLHVRRIPEQHGHHGRRLGHGDDPHGLRQQPEEHTGAVSARNAVAAGARARPIQERHAGEGRLLRRDVVRGLCRYTPRLYDDPLPQLQQPLRHADPGGHLM